MGILYTISYKLMYLCVIVSITIYIVHHSNFTGLLNYLIYSSMILPMIGWYAPSKLLLKLCMYFILIITCNLISHIMIISNCFIRIVISVKLPLCIMCTHLYTITRLIIIITSVCIIILHGSIFALSLLHIFYNLPLNYYHQLIVIALLLNFNNILFYTFLRLKMLIRFNILYLSCKFSIIDVLCYYYIFNSYIPTLTHLNVILHRLTHLERNLDLNPLTTNKYRCINQINQSIMVYPVSLQNATVINHVDNYYSEMLDMFPNDIIENDTTQGQIDDDKYDYSILGSIDPDTHYFPNQRNLVCKNYTKESFNKSFYFQNNFSLYHVNIRSTPENLKQLIYYIQGIKYKFSVFAISETWLKNYNDTLYNIKGYSNECVNRENRPGSGVSLYIRNDLTYRIRTDLSI